MKRILTACAFFIFLAGCGALQSVSPDTRQLAVQYATAKVIDGEADKRARVIELVEQGRAFVESGAEVSIALLDEGVREQIRWDRLDPADQILIQAILSNARERLSTEIGSGVLDDNQKIAVLTVLDWIEAAAYGTPFSSS